MIAKHVTVERDNVLVRMDRGATVSTLEIDIEIPTSARYYAYRQTGQPCTLSGRREVRLVQSPRKHRDGV